MIGLLTARAEIESLGKLTEKDDILPIEFEQNNQEVSFIIKKDEFINKLIEKSKIFAVNIPEQEIDTDLCKHHEGEFEDKFKLCGFEKVKDALEFLNRNKEWGDIIFGNTIPTKGTVSSFKKMNNTSATQLIANPAEATTRGSTRSESRPEIGAKIAITTGCAIRTKPAVCGENPFVYCK